MNNKSFTLIELIIALALLAILASVAVVRFVDMSKKALDVQEKATINSLRTAILLYYAKETAWPRWDIWWVEGPFDLLQEPPPIEMESAHDYSNLDGKTWVKTFSTLVMGRSYRQWHIGCPHYDGWLTCAAGRKGFLWYYYPDGYPQSAGFPVACEPAGKTHSSGSIFRCPCGGH